MKNKKIFLMITLLLSLLLIFTACKKDKKPSSSDTSGIDESSLPDPNMDATVENNTPQEDISDILTIDGEKKTISSVLDFPDENNAGGPSAPSADQSSELSSPASSQSSSISSSSSTAASEKAQAYNHPSSATTGTTSSSKVPAQPSSAKTYTQSTPLKETSDLDARLSDLAVEVLKLINEERAAAGITALIPDPSLDEAAAIRSLEALYNPDLGHTRPDGTKALTVLKEIGYAKENLTMGENLVFTAYDADAKKIVELWRGSQGHYDNYMDPTYQYTGVSITFDENATYQLVGTQIFSN